MALPRASLEGRAVADPELRFASSGSAVCSVRMVAADRRRNDNGDWEDSDTLWVDVTCFGRLAENVAESIARGDEVLCHGKFRTEEWTDRESGGKRSKVTFIADSVAVSLRFRTVRHGEGKAAREKDSVTEASDPWAAPASSDPPF